MFPSLSPPHGIVQHIQKLARDFDDATARKQAHMYHTILKELYEMGTPAEQDYCERLMYSLEQAMLDIQPIIRQIPFPAEGYGNQLQRVG